MARSPFFTRHKRLKFIRHFVADNADLSFDFNDLKRLFTALDAYCAAHLPQENRGGWFPLVIAGGASLNHTPPHILCSAYAVYAHLARGDVNPVPFGSVPLGANVAAALQLEPDSGFVVVDRDGQPFPMTDFLVLLPASTQRMWTLDLYGLPPLSEEVDVLGWHSAAQPHYRAVASGQVLVHRPSRQVLDPMSLFTLAEEQLFFAEAVSFSKLERYRARLEELVGAPVDVIRQNTEQARKAVEACLAVAAYEAGGGVGR